MKYIVIILVVMWIFSYVKFRKHYKIDRLMSEFTRQRYQKDPNPQRAVEYASALMQAQQYKSALALFEDIKRQAMPGQFPFLDANIAFCNKPIPWVSGAVDHNGGSWWHNFQLARFGGRRQVAISQETGLAFNSMLRMMNR